MPSSTRCGLHVSTSDSRMDAPQGAKLIAANGSTAGADRGQKENNARYDLLRSISLRFKKKKRKEKGDPSVSVNACAADRSAV